MKKILLTALAVASLATASAQSAIDAYTLGRTDLRGTARFMSMGGAFGALGGDMTTLSYNPAGIGIYRSSEIGMTMDVNVNSTSMLFNAGKNTERDTRFLFDNIGYVGTARLNSTLRNFNWGFTYNRVASFDRRYAGGASSISNSMSNYIAGLANDYGVRVSDVKGTTHFDPYIGYDDYAAPWLTILGYQSSIISPEEPDSNDPNWKGLYGDRTTGASTVQVVEKGGIDEYNIALGGNFGNFLYWGMDFGILNLDFTRSTLYAEYLDNAYVGEDVTYSDGSHGTNFVRSQADWDLGNYYSCHGNGWNYKLGFIVKPIQELRLGFAFHTPTWYSLSEEYIADTQYNFPDTDIRSGYAQTNEGYYGLNDFNLRTPWRFIVSAAGVIENRMIISLDVDWTSQQYLHLSSPYYDEPDWNFDALPSDDPFYYSNKDIKDYYKTTVTFRAGAEFRVTNNFSVRAGYAHTSSPVKQDAADGEMTIYTSGLDPSYEFVDNTDYVTAGLGYRYKHFYMDAAYVYRHRSSKWHAFTVDPDYPAASGAIADLTDNNHQVVLSLGFKF